MRKVFALLLCAALLACSFPAMAAEGQTAFRELYSGEITTLNYLITATTAEFSLAANLIDTLVEYDRFGQVRPSLAESW